MIYVTVPGTIWYMTVPDMSCSVSPALAVLQQKLIVVWSTLGTTNLSCLEKRYWVTSESQLDSEWSSFLHGCRYRSSAKKVSPWILQNCRGLPLVGKATTAIASWLFSAQSALKVLSGQNTGHHGQHGWTTKRPLDHVCFLNGDDAEKAACVKSR